MLINRVTQKSRQKGVSLIEVLVSVIVLSIGLMGLAGLQTISVKSNQRAYLRTQATNLAYDITDRMRTNRATFLAGAYDGVAFEDPPPACTVINPAGTIAERDIQAWRNALACTLPQGTGRIQRNGNTATITVQWDDSQGEQAPQQFEMTTDL